MSQPTSTIIIAITGPSSSGKTTLSKYIISLLKALLPSPEPLLLHQDDFYLPDSQLPTVKISSGETIPNWDCIEALDTPRLAKTLAYLRQHGKLPEDFQSIQHLNESTLPKNPVPASLVEKHTELLSSALKSLPAGIFVAILDGFLLLPPPVLNQIKTSIESIIMLRTTREKMIQRREDRRYDTIEGAYWADPPGYVEDVVWSTYVADHKFLFDKEDVAGSAKTPEELKEMCGLNVEIAPAGELGDGSINGLLDWGVDTFVKVLETTGGKS